MVCPSCDRLVGVREPTCPHCGHAAPGLWGLSRFFQSLGQDLGVVQLIVGACALLYLLTLVADPSGIRMEGLFGMLSPSSESVIRFGASGAFPVYAGKRWWTVLSASWLHGSLLHIVFNMLWVRQLAPATARLFGPGRMVLIYLVSGATGFLMSSTAGAFFGFLPGPLAGARLTLGASASIFGLLGALVLYGRRGGSTALGRQAWSWAVMFFVFGLVMPGIDNYAHLGGFLGGYGMAKWLDPLRPERADHLLAALVGLLVTFLAIVASVVKGLG